MDNVSNTISSGFNSFVDFLPTLLGAIALVLVAWVLAVLIRKGVKQGLKMAGFNRHLVKWGVAQNEEQANTTVESIGNVLYYLVWLLFLPAILGMLGLTAVAQPISNMFDTALSFIPTLIGAIFILVIGYFVAKFAKNLVYNLALSLNLDKWMSKLSRSSDTPDATPTASQKNTLAKVLANLVFVVILIPIATAALDVLGIESISRPVIGVLNSILAAIPNILVAVILLGIGIFLAKFIGQLLADLLRGTGMNSLTKYLNTNGKMNLDLAKLTGQVVSVVIGIFFLVEALNVLNLEVLNTIGGAIIAYLPLVISALVILGLGIIGGTLLGNFISTSTKSEFFGEAVKYILIVFSIFMALDQLQFATNIVNTAFMFIMGGIAVAFAIAFGIGGRDVAKRTLEKAGNKVEKESNKTSDSSNDFTPPTM